MRSPTIMLPLSFVIFSCSGGGEEEFGSSGGSGDMVSFSFDCDSLDVDCPGAQKISNPLPINGREVKCAWSCALNTTEFRDSRFEELSEPARHIFTFRKVGDNCWEVVAVSADKCGEKISNDTFIDGYGHGQSGL